MGEFEPVHAVLHNGKEKQPVTMYLNEDAPWRDILVPREEDEIEEAQPVKTTE